MAQEDDLRALGKIMDFLRAVSIILAIINVYWYCLIAIPIHIDNCEYDTRNYQCVLVLL